MRLIRTVAAPAVAATALITGAVAAAPAFAKSDVTIAVSTHRAEVGHFVRVTGAGDNDAQGRYTQVCVQVLARHHWRDVRCSAPTSDASQGVSVTARLRRDAPATVHLRARLFDYVPHTRRHIDDQFTLPVTVRFTA